MNNTPTPTPLSDAELDDLFQDARDAAPSPSGDLLARIAADAAMVQAQDTPAIKTKRIPFWRQVLLEIGGLPAMGGLVASACAGVYLGFANPEITTGIWSGDLTINSTTDAVMSDPLLGDFIALTEGTDA